MYVAGAPEGFERLLEPLPVGVRFDSSPGPGVGIAHVFVADRKELTRQLKSLRKRLDPEAAVWVSWPKKSARIPTSVSENTIREIALPLGFVDIKVCAINEIWSGLKLVVRKKLR